MKSNFEFLEDNFPILAKLGELSEQYCYSDPNSCLMKLGMIGETIVNLIFTYDRIPFPADNTAVKRIDILLREGMITRDLADIFHALRKKRNLAAHENYSSVDDSKILLQMAHWYDDMFKFIAKHIDLNKMDKQCAIDLIDHLISILEHDEDCKQVKSHPQFLYVLRRQAPDLTEVLDAMILKCLPDFYNGVYKLETTINTKQDLPNFISDYIRRIHKNNVEQGKNGTFFRHVSRDIATIRNILMKENITYPTVLMNLVIATVADTILKSKDGISEKIDAVSLLICIVIQYSEDYQRNSDIYKLIYEKKEEISIDEEDFLASNIDGISLKIGLQFLFASMGIDTSTDILELLPFVQNDVATAITVTRIIIEYLELNDNVLFPRKIEAIVLQNTLQWIRSDNTDIRWNSTRILMALLRNSENERVINHKLVNLVDTDNVYIKNLILRNIYGTKGILASTREYIISKCSADPNYVVRMVCEKELQKNKQEDGEEIDQEYCNDIPK